MEKAAVIMTGFGKDRILTAIELCQRQRSSARGVINQVDDNVQDNISEKIARIIISYTDYVNKKVWFK